PLVAGTDACDFCRMTVSDVRFGAEVVARTGRVYTFDSIECVASWVGSSPLASDPKGIWVADYSTGALIPADSALYVRGGTVRSPMGREIAAFAAGVGKKQLAEGFGVGGEVLNWTDVLAYIRTQGLPGTPRADSAATTARTGRR
ncbi:MAG: nitrous oxide reductase accessory protein NosL, partial [Gemmatimonadaceae bacterium]